MKSGTGPTNVYHRNYSYERTFAAGTLQPMPTQYDCDAGLTMPDQNADGNPFECTDYTIRDIMTDATGKLFATGYNYAKNLLISGLAPANQGAPVLGAFKASQAYGLLPLDKAPVDLIDSQEPYNADFRHWPTALDIDASPYRNAQYFDVDQVSGSYFSGIMNALWRERLSKRSMSVGSPWFPEWEEYLNESGILHDFAYSGRQEDYEWHNYKCSGFTDTNSRGELIRGGEIFLRMKSWQGEKVGDKGWVYMSKDIAEKVFAIYGTSLFIPAVASASDIQLVKLSILDLILSYCYRLLEIYQRTQHP